jgi:hypothetical protein
MNRPSESLVFLKVGTLTYIDSNVRWINHSDKFGGYNYIIEWDYFEKMQNLLSKRPVVKEFPQDATIYIAKNSKLPKFKLREYFEQKNLIKVKSPMDADIVLLNREETVNFMKNCSSIEYDFIPTESVVNNLKWIKNEEGTKHHWSKSYLNNIDIFATEDKLSNLKNIYDLLDISTAGRNVIKFPFLTFKGWGRDRWKHLFENLYDIANSNATLIYDEDIVEEINEEGHEIKDSVFEMVEGMFQSGTDENATAGIEILANSNYKDRESFVKLVILLNRYNQLWFKKTRFFSDNVKVLIKYINKYKINWNLDWNVFVISMLNQPEFQKYHPLVVEYAMIKATNKINEMLSGAPIKSIDITIEL